MTVVQFPGKRTPQQLGRDFEEKWAAKHQLDAQPASGAMPAYPLDVGGVGILASLKHTIHRSMSIGVDLVHEMVSAARGPRSRGDKMPVLVVKFDGLSEPVWMMLESDAIALVKGEAGFEIKPSKLERKRAAAEPVIGGDDAA